MNSKKVVRRAGGVVLTAVGIGAGFWMSLILADILTFVWVILSVDNTLEGRGINEYASKIVAVFFAGLIAWFANTILLRIIKRDKRWVPIVTFLMVAWFAVMYVVSSPYNGSPINPFTGKAQDYYNDQFGVIHLIGSSAKVGPHGETVQPFNKDVAQEYERQSGERSTSLLDRWLFGNHADDMTLHMDVERIDILPNATIIHFAVRRTDNARLGRFYQPHRWNYLSDETGQTYDLVKDNATYPDWVEADTHKEWTEADADPNATNPEPHANTRIVRPDEVYRFTDEYPPLDPGIHHLLLNDSRFGKVVLDTQLAQAQNRLLVKSKNILQPEVQAEPATTSETTPIAAQ